jgi:hypothetical protein
MTIAAASAAARRPKRCSSRGSRQAPKALAGMAASKAVGSMKGPLEESVVRVVEQGIITVLAGSGSERSVSQSAPPAAAGRHYPVTLPA